jgi:hypothetical protein
MVVLPLDSCTVPYDATTMTSSKQHRHRPLTATLNRKSSGEYNTP